METQLSDRVKPVFHQANLFARTDKKVGTLPTCLCEFFRQPILTNHVAGFLFSPRVARTNSPSGKRALSITHRN